MADTRPGEDELIARYFAPIAGEGALGLKDDAAVLRPRPGHDLVVTVDAVVAGVHFFADDPAGSVAPQGARRQPLGPRRQGRGAGRFRADADPAAGLERGLARGVLRRARRGRPRLRLRAPRRRHRARSRHRHSLTAFGEVPAGGMVRTHHGSSRRGAVRQRHHRRCRARACHPRLLRTLMGLRSCPRRTGNSSPTATCTRSPATGSRPRSSPTRRPPWMSPTGSPAISPR